MNNNSELEALHAVPVQDGSGPSFGVALLGFVGSTTLVSTIMVLLSGL